MRPRIKLDVFGHLPQPFLDPVGGEEDSGERLGGGALPRLYPFEETRCQPVEVLECEHDDYSALRYPVAIP